MLISSNDGVSQIMVRLLRVRTIALCMMHCNAVDGHELAEIEGHAAYEKAAVPSLT